MIPVEQLNLDPKFRSPEVTSLAVDCYRRGGVDSLKALEEAFEKVSQIIPLGMATKLVFASMIRTAQESFEKSVKTLAERVVVKV